MAKKKKKDPVSYRDFHEGPKIYKICLTYYSINSTTQMLFSAYANFSGPEDYTHEQTRPVVDVI